MARGRAWQGARLGVLILAGPRFAPLFGSSSRAEVSIMGSLEVKGRKRSISGKIDRLAVTSGRVSIVDYKTNRPAPATIAGVPPAYVLQLALYRALLQPLYPAMRSRQHCCLPRLPA
ncbi:hypothetical protein AJ88_02545 [Mesorhizobium amorphae CCBAU 01583]|nr:hypothetical protein AJ88_02545 [Mesorhizobium amorphae CCBAU 01583]